MIQAHEFGEVLLSKYPSLKLNYITKSTSGDIDLKHLYHKCQVKECSQMI